MDSSEIKNYLARNVHTRYVFGKVLEIDELDFILECYFIVNTQPRFLPGEHWFAIFAQ